MISLVSCSGSALTSLVSNADNRDNDPNHSNNNDIGELLDPKGGTSNLWMGLSLQAPIPTMSKDTIPAYNLDKAMTIDVDGPGAVKTFPILEEEEKTWGPEKDEGPTQWKTVTAAWNSAPTPNDIVSLFGDVTGINGLSTKKPVIYLNNLDKLCLKAPLLKVF